MGRVEEVLIIRAVIDVRIPIKVTPEQAQFFNNRQDVSKGRYEFRYTIKQVDVDRRLTEVERKFSRELSIKRTTPGVKSI